MLFEFTTDYGSRAAVRLSAVIGIGADARRGSFVHLRTGEVYSSETYEQLRERLLKCERLHQELLRGMI